MDEVVGNKLVTSSVHELLEKVVLGGDLSQLTPAQRLAYYKEVCEGLGLNPLTQPFEYIKLQGKLTLYATRRAADQLRRLYGVSIDSMDIKTDNDMAIVTVVGHDERGRSDTEVGVVSLANLSGDARANAVLKAVTKAKRRLTLSICGLGLLDETEVEAIPDAKPVTVTITGEIDEPKPEPKVDAATLNEIRKEHREHWINSVTKSGEPIRKRFWDKMVELGLNYSDVREALGLGVNQTVEDYHGSMQEAMDAINAYISLKAGDVEVKDGAE